MHVDKAGRQHLARGIDNVLGLRVDRWRDLHDTIAADRHVGAVFGAAAAVDDGGILEKPVMLHNTSLPFCS